ncbi:MAG: bi-domain-containing oxidoreductase [Sphingomicrobium sp.]
MKQIEQHYRSGRMRLVDVPAPRPGPGAALVRTTVSLISAGTEKQIVELAKASLAGKAMARPDLVRQVIRKARTEGLLQTIKKVRAKLDTPIPLGYSLAGVVVEAGPASGVAVGDRVACAGAGIANHADYNVVPKNLMARIPDGVSDEAASFATVGAIALQGVRITAPQLGERVVVMGLGLIGLLTVQLLKANGCRVLGYDPNPDRAALAEALGADEAVSAGLDAATLAFTAGHGADAVVLTASTSSNEPINHAATISRMRGRVVVVGLVGMQLDRDPFYKRELDLRLAMSTGPGRYDADYEQGGRDYPLPYVRWTEQRNLAAFLELVAAGRVTPEALVSHRFPIANALAAYAVLEGKEPSLAITLGYADGGSAPARSVAIASHAAPTGDGIAFVGMGNYGKAVLLPAVKAAGAGASLSTVVTATGLSAVGSAESLGFARAATDIGEVLADPATSTLFIATRHDSHARIAIAGLEAGKHVFVEKPLAMTGGELDAVVAAAQASPAILTVGFNRRFAPMLVEAAAVLAAAPGPSYMSYRINAGPIPRDSWVHGSEGGGRIVGELCHFVDALSALCGADPVAWEALSPPGIDDGLAATLRFADGSVGTILYAPAGDPAMPKERIEAIGPGVSLVIDDFARLTVHQGGKSRTVKRTQDKGQRALVKAFLDGRARSNPPIALATLAAVSRATLDLAGR